MGKSGKAGGAGGGGASTSPVAAAPTPPVGNFASRFEQAFKELDPRGRNFVNLADLREKLGVDRETFDAGLRSLRSDRQFTLGASQRLGGQGLSPREQAAVIREGGANYLYVSRIE